MGLAFADEVANRGGRQQHLAGRDAPGAVGGGQQLLRHDALQGDRQLHADLLLLGGGKDVDDAVDRLRRVLRVQGGEDEVAGLRRRQGGVDRLEVAHLADEDHVGVLAQGGLQAGAEGRGVGADLALVDDALLMAVEELDRVLDGHDVLFARLVDLVDDGRQRGRLARAGRARDEHEAARLLRHLVQRARHAELVERLDDGRDQAERRPDRRALVIGVDTEAGASRDRVGEVDLPLGLEALTLVVGEDRVDDLPRHLGRHDRVVVQRRQPPAHADRRVSSRGQMQVGGVALDDLEQQVGEVKVHCRGYRRAGRPGDANGQRSGRPYDQTEICLLPSR